MNMEVGVNLEEHGFRQGRVKKRAVDADGKLIGVANDNVSLDSQAHEIEFLDGQQSFQLLMPLQRTCWQKQTLKVTDSCSWKKLRIMGRLLTLFPSTKGHSQRHTKSKERKEPPRDGNSLSDGKVAPLIG